VLLAQALTVDDALGCLLVEKVGDNIRGPAASANTGTINGRPPWPIVELELVAGPDLAVGFTQRAV